MQPNLEELPAFLRLAARIGIFEAYVQRLVPNGHGLAVADESPLRSLREREERLLVEAAALAWALAVGLWQLYIALGSYSVPGECYWIWFLPIAPHLVFAESRAGRRLGIDRLLRARLVPGDRGASAMGRLLPRLT